MIDVSVVVPFYNSEKHLHRCLRSLQSQKMMGVEFILVNDGSTDDSLLICNNFLKNDDRFILISIDHKGVSAARNIGLSNTKGKYVLFLDSDDRLLSNALYKLFCIAEKQSVDSIIFNAKLIHGEKWMKDSFKRHNELIENFSPSDIFTHRDCRPFIWSHFIRNELLKKLYFNEKLELGEDQEYIIRYLLKAKRVLFTSKKFYCHYNYPDSSFNKLYSNPDAVCDNHIKMVESVLQEIDLESVSFVEWVFDTLYASFDHSSKTKENKERILRIFNENSIAERLIDDRRKNNLNFLLFHDYD